MPTRIGLVIDGMDGILETTNKYGKPVGESLEALVEWLKEKHLNGWADSLSILLGKTRELDR